MSNLQSGDRNENGHAEPLLRESVFACYTERNAVQYLNEVNKLHRIKGEKSEVCKE